MEDADRLMTPVTLDDLSYLKEDLKAEVNLVTDVWRDRCLIVLLAPSFRQDLVDEIMLIRQSVRQCGTLLSIAGIKILEITSIFLEIASRDKTLHDQNWFTKYESELDTVFQNLKDVRIR